MTDAHVNTAAQPAILELSGDLRLAGTITPMPDGSLQLSNARLLKGTSKQGKLSLRVGTRAQLSFDNPQSPQAAAVTVDGVAGRTITLTRDSDSQQRAHLRDNSQAAKSSNAHPADKLALIGTSAEYTEVLQTLHDQSLELLKHQLQPFMIDLTSYLLDLSSRLKQSSSGENVHYEATTIVRGTSKSMIASILKQISGFYYDLAPETPDNSPWDAHADESKDLGLIDVKEFEDRLVIHRMVSVGEEQHKLVLETLQLRIATLVDEDPLAVRLPVHLRQLSTAFQHALREQNLPASVVPHIFDYFGKRFIGNLGPYYDALNQTLLSHEVCPELEVEIKTKGSILERKRLRGELKRPKPPTPKKEAGSLQQSIAQAMKPDPDLPTGPDSRQGLEEVVTQLTRKNAPGNIYKSVIDALNFRREAEGLADGEAAASGAALSGQWDGTTVASADVDQHSLADARAIASALGAIQRDSQVRADVHQSSSLREYLASNRDQMGALKDTSGLTAESLNQLDMVDNLFGTIQSQLDVTSELKPALGNLQIPLAKLALLDPRFFLDRTHSARAVVDKLSHLAASANFPNKALENRISAIADEIVNDYESDSSVFDTALVKIDKLAFQQERALSRNIERVVRIQEGQEKLQKARQTVADVIQSRIQPTAAPQVLLDLMDSGWQDLLVLTHVKEGEQSQAWRDQIKTLELLILWLAERQSGDLDEDLIVQRGMEAGTVIDMIGQQITSALPTNLAHQAVLDELRDIMAGNTEVVAADISQDAQYGERDAAQVRAKIEDLPRLRRWVQRVEQLEEDSWLTYKDKDGTRRRMQLAWISEARDRYIFVNERGQKNADLSAIQLARQLSRGVQPPAPADKLSVVDQSMYQTLEHVQQTLSFARNHDSLTKLINQETFLNQMGRALRHAQLKHSQHALLFLNIDQFSLVNEVYDRVNGDQVLLEFARLLAQLHGKKSSSARLEADEFAVLLLDRSLEQAEKIAEKIRADIESGSVDIEGEKVSFTVSIGIAPIMDYSPSVKELLEAAHTAMRHAKEQGRNCVALFDEDQEVAASYKQERSKTRDNLEQALETKRFVLRAQPIVKVAVDDTETVSRHYELLLGLSNKDGSLSSPLEFIQSAERYGFMTLVDRWVIKEAFGWISQLMDAQKVVPNLAINLSGTSVTDDSFMEYLLDQISEFGVGTSRICFEITETGTISNLVKAADFVRAFRNIGCKFSIDDFGTGLAGHNYLRELPVDYVKIDGSFITGINDNRHDYAMARSINDLAHFLGQETIAESVETEDIVNKLQEIGVDYLQGWGVGRPKLLTEVTEDLSSIEK